MSQRGRPYLFSTSQPPAVAALDLLDLRDDGASDQTVALRAKAERWRVSLGELGYDTGRSTTPIVPVLLGEARRAKALSAALRRRGVLAQAIVYPTVALGTARVRTIVTASHTDAHLETALAAFAAARHDLDS